MAGSSLLHVLALICPFVMKYVNDQMALAIAKTWPLRWCLCGRRVSISSGYIRSNSHPHGAHPDLVPWSTTACSCPVTVSIDRRTSLPASVFPFVIQTLHDQMALAIAKTWPVCVCL